jgi:hypothetical protein
VSIFTVKEQAEKQASMKQAVSKAMLAVSFMLISRSVYFSTLKMEVTCSLGRVIAEAVSRWLLTAAARVRARVWSSGICGGQSGVGTGFLRVLRFPLPKPFIPPTSSSSQSPGAGTIGQ